jgi:NAD(P)-dependent dehydrogenase (short-subunit alcohol dehydrogenase family)
VRRALAESTAVVTGGAAGIGLATARALRRTGTRVLVVDVVEAPADAADAYVHADVSRPEAWLRIADAAEQELGGIDLAFLNAGVASAQAEIATVDDDEVVRIIATDLMGVIYGVRAVLPSMRRRGGGAIVATASLAGLIPYPPDPLYAAAKHGVVGFVRAMAGRLEAESITVNTVCPGLTDTAIIPALAREAVEREQYPLIAPEGIAAAVIALLAGRETGKAYICQPGREPIDYAFRGVPGPASGQAPPAIVSQSSIPEAALR